jgi:hypothetical protein
MPNFIDLTGQRFTRLTVLRRGPDYRRGIPQFWCKCDCGNERLVHSKNLRGGTTLSCGCLNKDVHRDVCIERNTTHRLSKTPTYDVWVNMLSRCRNPNASSYERYGAKGIGVCGSWLKFENFLADMGERPGPSYSIDRKDNSKGYEPENCRWVATMREQQENRTNNLRISFDGQNHTITEWARRTGLGRMTIWSRIYKLDWPVKIALTTPADPGNRVKRRP